MIPIANFESLICRLIRDIVSPCDNRATARVDLSNFGSLWRIRHPPRFQIGIRHGKPEPTVRAVASQSPWRMAMPLPAGLQNSHQNGARVFLISVADPITVRLCRIARRVNLAGAPLRRASQRAPGRTEIPRAAAVLARGEADGGPTHALRCAPSGGGSSGRRKGCHFVKSGRSGLSRRSASESFEFRCPGRAVHRAVGGR